MTLDDINNDLTAAGAPAVKFPAVGTTFTGVLINGEKRQSRDYETGEPEFWKDGNPKYEYVLLMEDQNSGENVRLFARGLLWKAVLGAVKDADGQLIPGGTLTVKYTGDGESTNPRLSPPKLYSAKWVPPAPSAVINIDDSEPF
jgi:hypothetical protein